MKKILFVIALLILLLNAGIGYAAATYTEHDKNGNIISSGTIEDDIDSGFFWSDSQNLFKINGVLKLRSLQAVNNTTFEISGDIEGYPPASREGGKIAVDGSCISLHHGIISEYNGNTSITGNITTAGQNNSGIVCVTNSVASAGGDILTDGSWAYGVWTENNSNVEVGGNITVQGSGTRGVGARKDSAVTVGGSIKTDAQDGYWATGVDAEEGSNVTVRGSISTKGTDSIGAWAKASTISAKSITTNGDSSHGIRAQDESTVTADGSITTTGEGAFGVYAQDESTVTVDGNIITNSQSSPGVNAYESTVTINGNVTTNDKHSKGVFAEENSSVTINGSIFTYGSNGSNGAEAHNESTVRVSGNVLASGRSFGAFALSGAKIIVDGSVSAQHNALRAEGSGTYMINQNLTSFDYSALFLNLLSETLNDLEDCTIMVGGDVSSANGFAPIQFFRDGDTESILAHLPRIVVYSLNRPSDSVPFISEETQDDANVTNDLTQALLDSIEYIVKTGSEHITVTGCTGSATLENSRGETTTYPTARAGTKLTVTPAKGRLLRNVYAGRYATVEANKDGSYTVTVNDGGDVTIVADCINLASAMPVTGDSASLALWASLLVLSGMLFGMLKRRAA